MNRIMYFFFFFSCLFFSEAKLSKKEFLLIFSFLTSLLVVFTGLREPNIDYSVYVKTFDSSGISYMETSFMVIKKILNKFHISYVGLFITYAFLSIPLRVFSIYKLSDEKNYVYSFLIYISNVYLLQDFTQIRVAVSTSILFFSLIFVKKKKFLCYLFCILLALFFHRTSIIFFPMYFLNNKKENRFFYCFSLMCIFIICGVLNFSIIEIIEKLPLGSYSSFITNYKEIAKNSTDNSGWNYINIFNIGYLFRIGLFLIGSYYCKKISENDAFFPYCLKVYCIGLILYSLFSALPVMATRLSELFYFVDLLYIPSLTYIIKEKQGRRLFIVLVSIFMVIINIHSKGLI